MYLCIYIHVPLFHFFYSCWCNDQRYTIYDTQICRPTLTLTRSFKGAHVLGLFLEPRKLTWNIAVEVWKMIFPCKWGILGSMLLPRLIDAYTFMYSEIHHLLTEFWFNEAASKGCYRLLKRYEEVWGDILYRRS